MITTSTFTAGQLQQVSIRIYWSCFPVPGPQTLQTHRNKHYSCCFSLGGLWNNNKGDKVVFWAGARLGVSECSSLFTSAVTSTEPDPNEPAREVHDCIWTGDTETALGGGCWLIINEGQYLGCSQSCMCLRDTTAQVPEALCTITITSQHFTAGFTLLSVCHDCAVTWKYEPAKRPGLTQLWWVTPRKWPR